MKMSIGLFNELENDVRAVLKSHRDKGDNTPLERKHMWLFFNTIMFDRMNDDSHPAFASANPRKRVLPFWSKNGETRDMQGNDHWLNRFYKDEDLNDSHITTALNRIHHRIEQENI